MTSLKNKCNEIIKTVISSFIKYSHLGLYDNISKYVPNIKYLFALSWALIQSMLTYHFFPEIFIFLSSLLSFPITLQSHILILAVLATFITFFMVGLSVQNNLNNIYKAINESETITKTLSIVFILLVTHGLAFGYVYEWAAKMCAILPFPLYLNYALCGFAVVNLLFFSLERCIASLDYFASQKKLFEAKNIIMFVCVHIFMFGMLGIFNFNLPVIISAATGFGVCYYLKKYDSSKSFFQNFDNILNEWIFLIMHAVSEGAIVGAGIFLSLTGVITNPLVLKYITGLCIAASTICEEMEDLVHNDCEESKLMLADMDIRHKDIINSGISNNVLMNKFGYTEDTILKHKDNSQNKEVGLVDIVSLKRSGLDVKSILKTLKVNSNYIVQSRLFAEEELLDAGITEYELFINSRVMHFVVAKLVTFNMISLLIILCMSPSLFIGQFVLCTNLAMLSYAFTQDKECFTKVGLYKKVQACFNYYKNRKWSRFILTKIKENFIFFVSVVTAFCVGLNGGLEFYHVFGTDINIVFLIAIAGMVVESLVYFDQISKNSDNDDHEHGNINIFSAIFNIENIITGAVFSAIAYSLSSAFLSSGILSSSYVYISIMLLTSLMGRECFASLSRSMRKTRNRNIILYSLSSILLIYTASNIFLASQYGVVLPIWLMTILNTPLLMILLIIPVAVIYVKDYLNNNNKIKVVNWKKDRPINAKELKENPNKQLKNLTEESNILTENNESEDDLGKTYNSEITAKIKGQEPHSLNNRLSTLVYCVPVDTDLSCCGNNSCVSFEQEKSDYTGAQKNKELKERIKNFIDNGSHEKSRIFKDILSEDPQKTYSR